MKRRDSSSGVKAGKQTPDTAKPLGPWDPIYKWIFDRFGVRGLVLLALLGVVAYVALEREKVGNLPVINHVVAYFKRWPIPKADPNRYSVIIARLENDGNQEHQRLIVEALKEFRGIQVLVLDQTISVEGPVPEEKEKKGHESARGYLKQTGGSVLIWGTVLSRHGKTVPKLYWTPSQEQLKQEAEKDREPKHYDAPRFEDQFQLPQVFWSDLSEVLCLLVASQDAEFSAKDGHYVADRLPPFITKVQTLLNESAGRPGWDADARGRTYVILADALQVLGDQTGKSEPLLEAIVAYQEALKERTRERVPLGWAMTQNNLGNALRSLGEREGGTDRREDAVAAFKASLEVFELAQATHYIEGTKRNLQRAEALLQERRK